MPVEYFNKNAVCKKKYMGKKLQMHFQNSLVSSFR